MPSKNGNSAPGTGYANQSLTEVELRRVLRELDDMKRQIKDLRREAARKSARESADLKKTQSIQSAINAATNVTVQVLVASLDVETARGKIRGELQRLHGVIQERSNSWLGIASGVGIAYANAYKNFTDALSSQEASDSFYKQCLFAVLSVCSAGWLVGLFEEQKQLLEAAKDIRSTSIRSALASPTRLAFANILSKSTVQETIKGLTDKTLGQVPGYSTPSPSNTIPGRIQEPYVFGERIKQNLYNMFDYDLKFLNALLEKLDGTSTSSVAPGTDKIVAAFIDSYIRFLKTPTLAPPSHIDFDELAATLEKGLWAEWIARNISELAVKLDRDNPLSGIGFLTSSVASPDAFGESNLGHRIFTRMKEADFLKDAGIDKGLADGVSKMSGAIQLPDDAKLALVDWANNKWKPPKIFPC